LCNIFIVGAIKTDGWYKKEIREFQGRANNQFPLRPDLSVRCSLVYSNKRSLANDKFCNIAYNTKDVYKFPMLFPFYVTKVYKIPKLVPPIYQSIQ